MAFTRTAPLTGSWGWLEAVCPLGSWHSPNHLMGLRVAASAPARSPTRWRVPCQSARVSVGKGLQSGRMIRTFMNKNLPTLETFCHSVQTLCACGLFVAGQGWARGSLLHSRTWQKDRRECLLTEGRRPKRPTECPDVRSRFPYPVTTPSLSPHSSCSAPTLPAQLPLFPRASSGASGEAGLILVL